MLDAGSDALRWFNIAIGCVIITSLVIQLVLSRSKTTWIDLGKLGTLLLVGATSYGTYESVVSNTPVGFRVQVYSAALIFTLVSIWADFFAKRRLVKYRDRLKYSSDSIRRLRMNLNGEVDTSWSSYQGLVEHHTDRHSEE